MMIFLAILVVGFAYEWAKGALDWEWWIVLFWKTIQAKFSKGWVYYEFGTGA